MLEKGIISPKEYARLEQLEKEVQQVNLGHVFITYSHSVSHSNLNFLQDEAKLALIVAQGLLMDGMEIDVSNKTDRVDHKDFD